LESASGSDSESKREIIEIVDAYRGILWDVFGHSGNMGLDDMIAIQEGHFTSSLDPDFMFGVLGNEIKRGDAESELAGFSELADVDASSKEFFFGYVGGEGNELAVDVEDFALDEAEDRLLDGVLDEVFEGVADVLVEFGEEDFCLLVGQWAHAC
jgi:hypothetical protein